MDWDGFTTMGEKFRRERNKGIERVDEQMQKGCPFSMQ